MSVPVHKFADFELDSARFELRRKGRALKLERIPMELLLFLAEKDGDIVTRQQIVERLWGNSVFVDTEAGINTAVRKIRQALRDDPDEPRFVQTVTGKGYRFIAERSTVPSANSETLIAPVQPNPSPPTVPDVIDVPQPKLPWRRIAFAALIVLLSGTMLVAINPRGFHIRLFNSSPAAPIHSVAVLPLANLSGDSSQDYFADGMTDEVITMLAKNTSLRVVSRTSVMRYKGVNRPVTDIARELGVDGILEGSISRSAGRVHMTVQLIHAPTDTHLWAESYDRDLSLASSLPSELSQTIAKEVKVAASPLPLQHTINPEAHDDYLRGRYFWFNGDDRRSQEFYEKAIQIQPDYAAAWAGLSNSYALRAVSDECPAKDVTAHVEAAAHKAVELDPLLAEAHHSLAAYYFFYAWDLPHADAESRRSIELDPSIAEEHHLHSYILFAMRQFDQAMQEQKRATELDPFIRTWALGRAYLMLRQFDAAISELRLRAEAMPNVALIHGVLAEAYWSKHMWEESAKELEASLRLEGSPEEAEATRKAFERGGEKALLERSLNDLRSRARTSYVSPFAFARKYAYLGDKEHTLLYLEQSFREHQPWLVMLQSEPEFDFLHADPRYQALIKKMGLPQ